MTEDLAFWTKISSALRRTADRSDEYLDDDYGWKRGTTARMRKAVLNAFIEKKAPKPKASTRPRKRAKH